MSDLSRAQLEAEETTVIVSFPVTLEDVRTQLAPLRSVSFLESYDAGKRALATCRGLRGEIEKRRKFLKADSLAYGREVDRVAGLLEQAVREVETPLSADKDAVDAAKAAEKERKVREAREANEAAFRAAQAEREATLKRELEQREAEVARERAANEAARKVLEQEKATARAQIEAEKAAMRAELETLRKEKAAREAEERAARRAKEIAAEQAETELREREFEAQRQKRLAELEPDKVKVRAFAERIAALAAQAPQVHDGAAKSLVYEAVVVLQDAAHVLRQWEST